MFLLPEKEYYHSQCGKELDVPDIFADCRKGPADPENYYFYMTDDTMTRIAEADKPIVYHWVPSGKPGSYPHRQILWPCHAAEAQGKFRCGL